MARSGLSLSRDQIVAFRQAAGGLSGRLPRGRRSLRAAAWAGLQDSMPRAAVLSMHARVGGIGPEVWEDPYFVQVWGPRFSVYVVPARDVAVFTLGRLPDDARGRARAYGLADKLGVLLEGGPMPMGEAGRALGIDPNQLRYAASTGSILIRWDGARQPTIRVAPAPEVDPGAARRELARRYLRVFGPSTADAFAGWAGIRRYDAATTFGQLEPTLTEVSTPLGSAWLLDGDVEVARSPRDGSGEVRLLPSGDAYYLLKGDDRSLIVPHPGRRELLWTSRVWPGAIFVDGEIVGTWRRTGSRLSANAWHPLPQSVRDAIEAEAATLPLPDDGPVELMWDEPGLA